MLRLMWGKMCGLALCSVLSRSKNQTGSPFPAPAGRRCRAARRLRRRHRARGDGSAGLARPGPATDSTGHRDRRPGGDGAELQAARIAGLQLAEEFSPGGLRVKTPANLVNLRQPLLILFLLACTRHRFSHCTVNVFALLHLCCILSEL